MKVVPVDVISHFGNILRSMRPIVLHVLDGLTDGSLVFMRLEFFRNRRHRGSSESRIFDHHEQFLIST